MSSSKSMLLRVVLLLEILLLVTANNGERKRFCGQHLTETLQFFCQNRYARLPTINAEKRSGDNEDYAYLSDEPLADSSPFSYQSMPFLASFGSAAANRPRVRRDFWYLRRGVADECCVKACTIQELKSYCF